MKQKKHPYHNTVFSEKTASPLPLVVGGVALALSYPPFSFFILAWVALVPLLLRWDRSSRLTTHFGEAYILFLVSYAIAFFWPLLQTYSENFFFSLGGILLVPLLLALPFPLSLYVRIRLGRGPGFLALLSFYLSTEFFLGMGPVAFPWPLLGHTQTEVLNMIQYAEYTGVLGISGWLLLINGLVFYTLLNLQAFDKKRVLAPITLAVALAIPLIHGLWSRAHLPQPERYITVGLVQPGTPGGQIASIHNTAYLQRLLALSDSLITAINAAPAFMIWPEADVASTVSEQRRQQLYQGLQAWSDARQVALMTGDMVLADETHSPSRYHKSALLFRPNAQEMRYDQMHYTPFAQRVPMSDYAPWLESLFLPTKTSTRYAPGVRQATMRHDGMKVGVLLGYESLLSSYARGYSPEADFLVSMTLDGWWGLAPGFRRHLAYLKLRSIENRQTVVQVAASGSTALLLPDGTIVNAIGAQQRQARLAAVPIYHQTSFYAKYGNWLGWIAVFGASCFLGWIVVIHRLRYRI